VCLCNRISKDRFENRSITGGPISQLFICRSRSLRYQVYKYQQQYCFAQSAIEDQEMNSSADTARFLTLDEFIFHMNEIVSEAYPVQFNYFTNFFWARKINLSQFQKLVYEPSDMHKRYDLPALTIWTQIRSFIK
jgi:hypothetical protein